MVGSKNWQLKEKELLVKARTHPKQKKLWSFVKNIDDVEVSRYLLSYISIYSRTWLTRS
jgi:hypothetical protein